MNLGCWELFDEQNIEYRQNVLGPTSSLRVSIEAGITNGWEHYTGLNVSLPEIGDYTPSEIFDWIFLKTQKNMLYF